MFLEQCIQHLFCFHAEGGVLCHEFLSGGWYMRAAPGFATLLTFQYPAPCFSVRAEIFRPLLYEIPIWRQASSKDEVSSGVGAIDEGLRHKKVCLSSAEVESQNAKRINPDAGLSDYSLYPPEYP